MFNRIISSLSGRGSLPFRLIRRGLLALAVGLAAAGPGRAQSAPATAARFFGLLRAGDSVYAQKKGYRSFAHAQRYYDRAQLLADRAQDTLLLAEAVFARGRVYDAWNKEPQKTVAYFREATALFARLPAQRRRYFYAKFLLAHAYDKVPDSLRTVRVLRELRQELAGQPDSLLRQVPSTVEMALTATQVRNYALADSLLGQLVRRPWVRNDPETYDYLTHYYLAQARLDVFYRRRRPAPYLDSLARLRATNLMDRVYYGHNLAELYAAAGQYPAAYAARTRAALLNDSLNNGGEVEQVRRSLLRSEEQALARQRRYEASRQRARTWGLWGLGAALTIITLLSFYLYRQGHRSRQQARALAQANTALAGSNQELDQQVAQVELLNKEIQHRVKNNLHMIYSLLQMQERRTDNEEVIAHLQTARLRVESIAALHNQLLSNPEAPDLAAYLRSLISSVVSCLATDCQVVTHLQTGEHPLPAGSHLALSLILNEWVTNSVKYADPADHLLEISVRLRHEAGATCLTYFDNGRLAAGTPPPPAGLGTQIITLLTRQLGATVHTPAGQPYHYDLCLPDGKPA
ncbi:sensor histidine kinase [Hymenobacter sp. IS2118]|uniref:sensor histidine kinase n=1 Tax=Hymenobacter sp. IS2118 TaxID=1505605 RepID=UPI000550E792|nr:sensor histidine kinase [Hymenobacter sp. IS2118]